MSVYSSVNELKIKLQQKNMILISGNIYEILPKMENGAMQSEATTIAGFVADELQSQGYDKVEKFVPNKGLIDLITNKESVIKIIEEEGDIYKEEVARYESYNFEKFLKRILFELKKFSTTNGLKKAYIIDFADIYFHNLIESEDKTIIADILASFLEMLNPEMNKLIDKIPKIIFMQRNSNQLPPILKIDNPELVNIEIGKPSFQERSEWLKIFGKTFRTSDVADLVNRKSNEHTEAVALTSTLTFREIMQFGRIKHENTSITFKELYNLAIHNRRESEWSKISLNQIKNMDQKFKAKLKGQDQAIEKVINTLILSRMGLIDATHSSNNAKPKGVLFMTGPTGTGKTELSKILSKEIFGDEKRLIRFDMSEYSFKDSSAKFIGSEPGYVGYEQGGLLTNAVKRNPFCVLLFDEIEKAHPSVLDKFLQILEDGRLTSSQGELVDFSETFIIFTSNIGQDSTNAYLSQEENKKHLIKGVIKHFKEKLGKPELLNRIGIDNIIAFNYITDKNIIKPLIKSKIKMVNDVIKQKHLINIKIPDSYLDDLVEQVEKSYDKTMGGRGINATVQKVYVQKMSKFLFENYDKIKKISNGNMLNVEGKLKNGKFVLSIIN